MGHRTRWAAAAPVIALVMVAGFSLSGCAAAPTVPSAGSSTQQSTISKVEPVAGSDISTVTLSADAAHRLDIQTEPVRETVVAGLTRKVVPYASVLYDAAGMAYAYSNPRPLGYLRVPLEVDSIDGGLAVLNDGPPPGTPVVTVGAAELFGTEFEVGGE